jgi:hypothetical protein
MVNSRVGDDAVIGTILNEIETLNAKGKPG